MSIAVSADARIRDIEVTDDSITAHYATQPLGRAAWTVLCSAM